MGLLSAPRFYADVVLSSCLDGHRIFQGSGDPPESVSRLQQALLDLGFDVTVDGKFGDGTGTAVHDFKAAQGLVPDDPVVGPGTMAALDAGFAHELFELKAAELAGGIFELGARIGTREEIDAGLALCRFEAGIVVELAKLLTIAVPGAIGEAWDAAGGQAGAAGVPAADPYLRDDGALAQDFANLTIVYRGEEPIVVPPAVRETLDWTAVGTPTGPADPGPGGTAGTPCTAGVIVDPGDGSAIPLPQPVFDAWLPLADRLGSPTALGFADTDDTTVFPFVAGTLAFGIGGDVVEAAAEGPAGRRFFLPPDPERHLRPAAPGSAVEHLIGGPAALSRIADDLRAATAPGDFVYLAGWNCELDLPLPSRAGTTSVRQLLTAAVAGGAQVRVQLWAADITAGLPPSITRPLADPLWFARTFLPLPLPAPLPTLPDLLLPQTVNNRMTASVVNMLPGDSAAILDDRHLQFGSHHQKIVVVSAAGSLVAYVGGIEVTNDRLDQILDKGKLHGSPLFDVSVRLTGPAAREVLRTFVERWQAHPAAHGAPLLGDALPAGPPAPTGSVTVQVTHTYGRGFPYPVAVQTAAAARVQALRQARNFFYFEDQYAVGSVAMDGAMRAALRAGATGVVVIAAEDSVSDLPDIPFRRREFLRPLVRDFPGAFFVFERLGDGTTVGRGAYVHSKLIVVDDEVAIVGSVNASRRSWTHDSEIDAVIVDDNGPGLAAAPATWGAPRRLRVDLWAQHLRLPGTALGEPGVGLAAFRAVAAGVPGPATIRPYAATAAVPRFAVPALPPLLVPLLPQLLDAAWDIAEDPVG